MTPTEQDKELREKIIEAIVSDPAIRIEGHYSDGSPIDEELAVETIMQLITADRKRVALEARIAELEKFVNTTNRSLSVKKLRDRLSALKANQEEV